MKKIKLQKLMIIIILEYSLILGLYFAQKIKNIAFTVMLFRINFFKNSTALPYILCFITFFFY